VKFSVVVFDFFLAFYLVFSEEYYARKIKWGILKIDGIKYVGVRMVKIPFKYRIEISTALCLNNKQWRVMW